MNTFPVSAKLGVVVIIAALIWSLCPGAEPLPVSAQASLPHVAVSGLAMSTRQSEQGTSASATVTALDGQGHPVVGALVTGAWSGLTSAKASALTNRLGRATFHSARSTALGDFVFDVSHITAVDAVYDATFNVKTRDKVSSLAPTELSHVSPR